MNYRKRHQDLEPILIASFAEIAAHIDASFSRLEANFIKRADAIEAKILELVRTLDEGRAQRQRYTKRLHDSSPTPSRTST